MPRAKGGSVPPPRVMIEPGYGGSIVELNEHDVLCGRGGKINNHPGNITFRTVVEHYKHEYLDPRTRKLEKAHVAARLVAQIRNSNPPGRFLKDDPLNHGQFIEIGDQKAWKKAGQALREDAPDVRKEIEEVLETEGQDLKEEPKDQSNYVPQHQPSSSQQLHRPGMPNGIPPSVSYSPTAAPMPLSLSTSVPRPDPPEAPGVTGYRQPPLRYFESGRGGAGRGGGQVSGRGRGPPPSPHEHQHQQNPTHPTQQGYHYSNYFGSPPPMNQPYNFPHPEQPTYQHNPQPQFQQQPFNHLHPQQYHPPQGYHPHLNHGGSYGWSSGPTYPHPQFTAPQHLHLRKKSQLDESKGSVQNRDFPLTASIGTEFTMSDVTALDESALRRLNSDITFGESTRLNSDNSQQISQGAKQVGQCANKESLGSSGTIKSFSDSITVTNLMASNQSLGMSIGSLVRIRSFPDLMMNTGQPLVSDKDTSAYTQEGKQALKVSTGSIMRPFHRKSSSASSNTSMASLTIRGFHPIRDTSNTAISGINDTMSLMSFNSRKENNSESSSWIDNFNSMQSIHSDMLPSRPMGDDGSVRSFLSDVSNDLNALDLAEPLLPPLSMNDSYEYMNRRVEYTNRPDP